MFNLTAAELGPSLGEPMADPVAQRQSLGEAYQACRASTLQLFKGMDPDTFRRQIHPDFSPLGWHLGHLAYTEALWLLERCGQRESPYPHYHRLYAADGLPKQERCHLPSLGETLVYLAQVRDQVLEVLAGADLARTGFLWHFILQHESQHAETMTLLQQLLGADPVVPPSPTPQEPTPMVEIPRGFFTRGYGQRDAQDHERPVQDIFLETYWIDSHPVTWGQYRQFMEAGGYGDRRWWSEAGWAWRQAQGIEAPAHGRGEGTWDRHPVVGVSWYEAIAYAKFVGKRLPTELEWEKAARWDPVQGRSRLYPWGDDPPSLAHCNYGGHRGQTTPVDAHPLGRSPWGCWDMVGNVWEWTASEFQGYPGYQPYPYRGYAQVYFDGHHRVLRGGSWATRTWALRPSWRNWYGPGVRQILAGFRCGGDRPFP